MKAVLEIRGLSKTFKGLRAVHDVSFDINEHEIFGMIGPNGAGKTTIFNMISGVDKPTSGSILFNGETIMNLQPNLICRKGVGRTYQITKPFLKLTVLENIVIGALNRTDSVNKAEKKAEELLARMGLENMAYTQGKNLTVPERKRLELARALATEPRLLLLDEVMAGLSPTELGEMINILKGIVRTGITIFVIEHIMRVIMTISQRIMVLHHGEMIAIGAPKEVASDARVIEAYLGEEYSFA
jgi:branched-chain amino acid transport system ATP-binding protein